MMAGLFFLFLGVQFLIIYGKKNLAMYLIILTIILCFGMLIHHATDVLKIRL